MLWRTRTIPLDRESVFQLEARMNFAAQFFANFVKDGLPETRRSFNDGEEYDPFWQRWERVYVLKKLTKPAFICAVKLLNIFTI